MNAFAGDTVAEIECCATEATKDARIVCLENMLKEMAGVEQDPPAAVVVPTVQTAAIPEHSTTTVDRAAEKLGAEQLEKSELLNDEPVRVLARVVSHHEVGYQKLRVELDNGQVWQQTDGDRIRVISKLRNRPEFSAEFWSTKTGGYRMHIPAENLTLRMRRLK